MLIFGAYLAHRSGDNNTDQSRIAVYLTYNAAREGDMRDHYYNEKRKLFPPSYEREEGKDYSKFFRKSFSSWHTNIDFVCFINR